MMPKPKRLRLVNVLERNLIVKQRKELQTETPTFCKCISVFVFFVTESLYPVLGVKRSFQKTVRILDMDMGLRAGSLVPLQWLPLVAYTDGHLILTLVFLESLRFRRQINLDPLIKSSPFRFPYPEETRVLSFSARFH